MPEILSPDGRRGIRLGTLRRPPRLDRVRLLAGERECKAELELYEGALRITRGEDPQPAGRPRRPGLQRFAHLPRHLGPGRRIRCEGRRLARLPLDVAPRGEGHSDHGPCGSRGGERDDDPDPGARAHPRRR